MLAFMEAYGKIPVLTKGLRSKPSTFTLFLHEIGFLCSFRGNTSHNLQINCLKSWVRLWSQEPSRTIAPQQMSFLHKRPRSRPTDYEGVLHLSGASLAPTTITGYYASFLHESEKTMTDVKPVATVHVYIHIVPT